MGVYATLGLVLLLLAKDVSDAFYLPGSSPRSYDKGAGIPIQVNKMSSTKTQIPYGYYSLDFCKPAVIESESENLGQILKGDLIQNTPYEVQMQVDEGCKVLCTTKLNNSSIKEFSSMIDDEYFVNLFGDDLPAALRIQTDVSVEPSLIVSGYPVGVKDMGSDKSSTAQHFLINHLDMIIKYFNSTQGNRVVGFELQPKSINHEIDEKGDAKCVTSGEPLNLDKKKEGDFIAFTYSVHFEASDVSWATRWDAYLNASSENAHVHWFSIINAFMIVVMLSAVVGTIFLRTLLKDIARYNDLDDTEDAQEESGWKLLHGDVFRRPSFSKLLATCVGTGIQVLCMILIVLAFAALGVLSPANRGALLQALLVCFALMGGPAGYVSARFNKLFQGDETHRSVIVTLWTAFQYTGVCFCVFLFLNFILWIKGSSGAVPFGYLFLVVLLWLGLSVPLVFVGSYMGYRKPTISLPVRTNQIPRHIPKPSWLMNPLVYMVAGGILPFGAVFSELTFIMSSVWQHKFYYLFGFLTLVLIILVVTCAETSIVCTYFQLTGEDYRWWWKSYLVSAFSAAYFLLFSIMYFFNRLEITRLGSTLLYFGYMFLASYTFFLVTGSIGLISSFWFVRAIYGAVKVD